MKNTPRVRFKGFSGEWEKQLLLENIERIIDFRGRTPKKLGHNWSDKGYLALSALNVKNGYIDLTVEAHFGDQNLYNKWMLGNELHKGQVLFTTEAPMGNVAQVPDNNKYILSQRTIAFVVNNKAIIEDFWATLLRTPKMHIKFLSLASGGTAKGVSQKSLKPVECQLPANTIEQAKIGNFFKNIDTLIAKNQQKYEKLTQMKKALLEKMFPKAGTKEPEIRFQGFSGEWDTYTLEEFGKATGGTSIESEFSNSGQYKVVNIGSYSEQSTYVDQGIRAKLSDKTITRVLGKNDLTMILNDKTSTGRIIGRVLLIESSNLYVYNQRTERIEIKKESFIPIFLYQMLNAPSIREKIIKQSQGNTQIYVNWTTIKNNTYQIPSIPEQHKIGELFRLLDKRISLQQEKIEKLKNMKRAFLEKMFV